MADLPQITLCPQQHYAHYPPDLEEAAIRLDSDLGFYTSCECGVAIVIVWAGDRLRVMARGDIALAEAFNATGWPEFDAGDPVNGSFYCRVLPNGGWALFESRLRRAAQG